MKLPETPFKVLAVAVGTLPEIIISVEESKYPWIFILSSLNIKCEQCFKSEIITNLENGTYIIFK